MKLNNADMIYFGNQKAQKVYLGSRLVWDLQQTDEQIEDTPIKLTGVHDSQSGRNGALTLPAVSRLSELGVDIYQVKQIEINSELFKVKDVSAFSSITFVFLDRPLGFRLTGDETIYLYTN